jgi:SPP1 family predicted phage head-tail adaptor
LYVIDPGELRHVGTIQSVSELDGAAGGVGVTVVVEDSWRFKIEPVRGHEYMEGAGQTATTTHKLTCRSYAGLTPSHQIVFGSRTFNVIEVRDLDERGLWMEVLCKETS